MAKPDILPPMESVLEFIRREVGYRIEVPDDEVRLESATALCDSSDTRGITISLVNVHVSAYQGSGLGRPELLDSIELHLLFSFKSKRYETSVSNLYKTLRLFFNRPTYTAARRILRTRFRSTSTSFFSRSSPWSSTSSSTCGGSTAACTCRAASTVFASFASAIPDLAVPLRRGVRPHERTTRFE